MFLASTFIKVPPDGQSLASMGSITVEFFKPSVPQEITPSAIFLNNLPVMLLTIIPQPNGVATVLFFAFKAGATFSVLAAAHGASGTEGALLAMSKPFFWFEIVAYCLTAAQSIELGRKLSPGGYRAILKRVVKELSLPRKHKPVGKKSISWQSFRTNMSKMYRKVRNQIPATIGILIVGTVLLAIGAYLESEEIASLARR